MDSDVWRGGLEPLSQTPVPLPSTHTSMMEVSGASFGSLDQPGTTTGSMSSYREVRAAVLVGVHVEQLVDVHLHLLRGRGRAPASAPAPAAAAPAAPAFVSLQYKSIINITASNH